MGYTKFKSCAAVLPDERPFVETARTVAERWLEIVKRRARELTPVSGVPEGLTESQHAGGRGRARGTARDSWRSGSVTRTGDRSFSAEFWSIDQIMVYLNYGTRAHWIRPRADRGGASVLESGKPRATGNRARLRFRIGGRIVYAREVFHPGTKPLLIVQRAVEESVGELREMLRTELQKNLHEAMAA